jgi:SAM-dependent methyltransferase
MEFLYRVPCIHLASLWRLAHLVTAVGFIPWFPGAAAMQVRPNLARSRQNGPAAFPLRDEATENVAAIYNRAGEDYYAYADGNPTRLFAFDGLHAYADRQVWAVLESKLRDLRASGANSISLLDAGCGPGTWLRRMVTHARKLGFTEITARGFDIAEAQVRRARLLARSLSGLPGVKLTFGVANLTGQLREADASVDITLCLYSVLSHLPIANLARVSAEIARVTKGHAVVTVRSVGSPPTAFVDLMENVHRVRQDHARDRCEIQLRDGRRNAFRVHLFTASELRSCFADHFAVEDLRGLDLFHSRFTPEPGWNPVALSSDSQFADELARLEQAYAASPAMMDRATHLLLVARSRRGTGTAAARTQDRNQPILR